MFNSEERYIKKVQKLIDYRHKKYYPAAITKMKHKIKELKRPHRKEMLLVSTLFGGIPILFSIIYFLVWFFTSNWGIEDCFICGIPFFIGTVVIALSYIRYRHDWRNSLYLEDVNYLDSLILQYNKEKNK